MKISLQTNYTRPIFSAKKKEIRKADDIQRKATANFPMFSPSYLQEFYCLNGKGQNTPKQVRTIQIAQRIVYKINAGRIVDDESSKKSYFVEPPFIRPLERIKKTKIGNCHEASIVTMATLAANGINDAKRVSLEQKTEYVHKKTNKVIFAKNYDLDHTIVISAMGKENPKEKDMIVLDSWMGFADSISGAKDKYARFIDENKNKSDFNDSFSLFRIDHFEETGEFLDKNDFYIRNRIVFKDEEKLSENEIKELGRCSRMMYPHLCL
ncbi:MAG: hypothetical protein IJY61_07180 [Candidatus Gastranaerophilales bacterium]|nr:hypothetical protein [Candidatus Gastranaerophilales bacterium]